MLQAEWIIRTIRRITKFQIQATNFSILNR